MKSLICFLLSLSAASAAPVIEIGVDTLYFGHVSAGGGHTRTLAISNAGDEDLIVSQIDLGDTIFVLLPPLPPDTIPPGQFEICSIAFHPLDQISYSRSFAIYSNDPATPTLQLPVMAQGVPVFDAGEIIWSYQGIENVVSCTARDDVDGDGFMDVVAESFDAGAVGDNLLCISGSGIGIGHLIWSASPLGGPSNSGGYGDECLITIDDLNSNGTRDIILGTAWGSRTVFAIEGNTGQTIWSYDTYQHAPSGWIYSVASMGDLDGDSIPEVLAGAGSDANAAFCFDGPTGAVRWKMSTPDVAYAVCRLDDVNDDGLADAVLGTGDNSVYLYCISGASVDSGAVIWRYTSGGSVQSVARVADLNGDGHNDVVAGTWYNSNRVMAISGHSSGNNPTVIWNVTTSSPVMKVVVCPDLDGDGLEDVLVASWASYALALSGADGSEIWRNYAGDDVWAIYWSYDVNGDSVAEVVSGSFTGEVALIDGVSGATIWSTPTPDNAKIFTVRPIPDINGDGFPDIIAGQQMLNGIGGKVFLLSGGRLQPSAIDDHEPTLPEDYFHLSNYPNPFNAATLISYDLPQAAEVRLEVFNVVGQRVDLVFKGHQETGKHVILWDASTAVPGGLSSGLYLLKITARETSVTRKMTILK